MRRAAPILLATLLCSCVSTALVHEGGQRVSGIPFYMKTSVPHQATEYEVRWYEVQLSVHVKRTEVVHTVVDDEPRLRPVVSSRPELRSGTVQLDQPDVLAYLHNRFDERDVDSLRGAVSSLASAIDPEDEIRAGRAVVVGNRLGRREFVDHGRVYYLNARMPWFGTGTVNPTLNSDGTLGKAELKSESTPEKLAELLPISEVLTAALVDEEDPEETEVVTYMDGIRVLVTDDGTESVIGVGRPRVETTIELRIVPRTLRRTYSKDLAQDESHDELGPDTPGVSFEDKAVAGATGGGPKPMGKAIQFSGSIQLPKEEPAKKP